MPLSEVEATSAVVTENVKPVFVTADTVQVPFSAVCVSPVMVTVVPGPKGRAPAASATANTKNRNARTLRTTDEVFSAFAAC